jgi:hypothetical protein
MPLKKRKLKKKVPVPVHEGKAMAQVSSVFATALKEARVLFDLKVLDSGRFTDYSLFLNDAYKRYLDEARTGNLEAGQRFFNLVMGHKKNTLKVATANSKISLGEEPSLAVPAVETKPHVLQNPVGANKQATDFHLRKKGITVGAKAKKGLKEEPLRKKPGQVEYAQPTEKGIRLAEANAKELSSQINVLENATFRESKYLPSEASHRLNELVRKRKILIDYMYGRLPADHKVAVFLNNLK